MDGVFYDPLFLFFIFGKQEKNKINGGWFGWYV